MFRCWVLFNHIIEDLMDAAEAMADGSYWDVEVVGETSWGSGGFEPTGGE